MGQIPNSRGNPQASDLAVQEALDFLGSLSREDLQTVLGLADSDIARLYEDRNLMLVGGGRVFFDGTQVTFTEDLLIEINSKIAGGAPTTINLSDTTRTISTDGRMIYAVIDRSAGTAVVTDDATSLPSVTSPNKEVVLIAKRKDSGITERLYFRNGTALNTGDSVELGASGSGGGEGNLLLERLRERFIDSSFEFVTPVIFQVDEEDLTDSSNTDASYSLITKTYDFDAAEVFQSVQMLDDEFLDEAIDVGKVELISYWEKDNIDDAATYEISKNGDSDFEEITMDRVGSTDTFRGYLELDDDNYSSGTLVYGFPNFVIMLNNAVPGLGQLFERTSTSVITSNKLHVGTLSASPIGKIQGKIVKDDGSDLPSTDEADIVALGSVIDVSTLSGSTNFWLDFEIPRVVLGPGKYHLIVTADDDFVSNGTQITFSNDSGSGASSLNTSGVWSAESGKKLSVDIQGYVLDLRVKITASQASKLAGFGVFYKNTPPVVTGVAELERFLISGDDNVTEFTVSRFQPHPDFLKVYDVNTGQVYRHGAFKIQGQKVIFEDDQFDDPGKTIILDFDQTMGGAFDTSDTNALLLAENNLGSLDATLDKSSSGNGILLRNANGDLRELALDADDNIIIRST